ncbi:bacterial regulatory helix-turn-helix, lysR family protein [Collimonas fungivorans]|jgi:DNA-binding transcriptional LysR family regulator|uniref:Bacterial regulatory helix-turn-helix, lysR family protein n=1 Tax=Collimonas fungivorans TaxID=158899 RepID=A0A127PHI0_9BURK|nr:LysR family transcriptional regulator [Collimonas fungivorans]AMO97262.1 bacterial regulatory helix-turn-helix, lysR family protein [Collimonas fungivorans]
MHISRIDLNLFVVLDTIYAEGNITRAAKALSLTQPAVSHALARLRELLGDPLFIRQGSKMLPTPMTRSLIGPVRQALQTLEVSVKHGNQFDPTTSRRSFSLGLPGVLEARLLPPLMQLLQIQAPMVEINSVRVERRQLESELAAGTLDIAVDVLLQRPGEIRSASLSRDTLVVVARQDHPALKHGLDLETYLAQNHILVSSRRTGPGVEDVELARIGRQRHIGLRCQHYYAACQVASVSDLLTTMPEHYAHIANINLPNRIYPLPLPTPPLDVYLYWHENAELDPANRWLRGLLGLLFPRADLPPGDTEKMDS